MSELTRGIIGIVVAGVITFAITTFFNLSNEAAFLVGTACGVIFVHVAVCTYGGDE